MIVGVRRDKDEVWQHINKKWDITLGQSQHKGTIDIGQIVRKAIKGQNSMITEHRDHKRSLTHFSITNQTSLTHFFSIKDQMSLRHFSFTNHKSKDRIQSAFEYNWIRLFMLKELDNNDKSESNLVIKNPKH